MLARVMLVPFSAGLYEVRAFGQALGAEMLANPDMNWTTGVLTGWTFSGTSGTATITEVAPGGGAGAGAAKFLSDTAAAPTAAQTTILTVGAWYEAEFIASAGTFGANPVGRIDLDAFSGGWVQRDRVGTAKTSRRAINSSVRILPINPPIDATIDRASLRSITLNALQVAAANCTHEFEFTLPGTAAAGMECQMWYRVVDDGNYWVASLRRSFDNSAWDFRLASWNAGTETNRVSVPGVGVPDAMRVGVAADGHTCFTRQSGTWTQRGSLVTNTLHNTATSARTLYDSSVTPIAHRGY